MLKAEKLTWAVDGKTILDDLSFSVGSGEFVGVIGPNGAGKSSLLRCLYRKNQLTSGMVEFAEQSLNDYTMRGLAQKIAVVLQEPPTRFELSVADVIRMGLTPNKPLLSFDTLDDQKAVEEAAEQVELSDKLEQEFNSLSGGEKQRAMIARAILQAPELLLMDEPTNHLDVRHQIEVLELARSLNISVIVSIHDLNLAAAYCDRLILLNRGRIVAQGAPELVLTKQQIQQVFEVNVHVDQHPFNRKLRITYDLGGEKHGR
ncbi:ABC transporter ATP-binding protein [Aliikangiella coralliicola]|uniref:ABC transporter ATP-binding protein n=1 Tax=Aliikangiella coralliicola TaxID=2592383 RepID=A0A545UK79_9GAMM|nr:ABC transporter ATP-binding protein [Aliikangiella coralliicola]